MTSITKVLIFITAITAISGKAAQLSIDADQPSAPVSELLDTLSRLNLIAPEIDFILPLSTKLDVLPPSQNPDTTNTKSIVSDHGNRRERRQALVKTRGADGPDSVISLPPSSYPSNVPRFQNGEVVDYRMIDFEVLKWIRQQLIVKKMNKIQKSTLKTGNIDHPQANI